MPWGFCSARGKRWTCDASGHYVDYRIGNATLSPIFTGSGSDQTRHVRTRYPHFKDPRRPELCSPPTVLQLHEEMMRNEMETAVPEWVSAQLRARQSVIDASQRLAQYGRFGLQEILKIALDPTVAVDLRTDALTLFAAQRGGEGALPMLLDQG